MHAAHSLDRGGIAPSINPDRIPQRVQRSRKRGAKMGDGVVYVGRPTIWGNPFTLERFSHARSILFYETWLEGRLGDLELEERGFCPAEIEALHRLRLRVHASFGKLWRRDLACWCPTTSSWCHANILLRFANDDLPRASFFQ